MIIILIMIPRDSVPFKQPDIKITYNNQEVSTIKGEFNWFNKKIGGNSNLAEPLENLKEPLYATGGETINIKFGKAPKRVSVREVSSTPYADFEYLKGNSEKEYSIILPKTKGTYYIEISGDYDETHSTVKVFKVIIE